MRSLLSLFTFLFLLPQISRAQSFPLGLYEGLMGNTGVAISDSMAASYYNPSLLNSRKKNSFNLGGNTFGSFSSQNSNTNFSSLHLSPGYLSSIYVGTNLVHEIFFAPVLSGTMKMISKTEDPAFQYESKMETLQTQFGYSMAFQTVPFALQILGQYRSAESIGFSEFANPSLNVYSTSHLQSKFQAVSAAIGVSGHARFGIYSFGVNFVSRGLELYKKAEGNIKSFIYNGTTYTTSETSSSGITMKSPGQTALIGHEFKIGDHQFLFDTKFQESSDLDNSYLATQSFGYKLNSSAQHQLMVGLNHSIGPQIKYFGQSYFTSVGYSWLSRLLRSSFGLYYSNSTIEDQKFNNYGITFSSEYRY